MEPKYNDLHRVVGTVIIYSPDRTYLITKRSQKLKVFPGKWTVPGGGLEVSDYIHTKPGRDKQWYGALELGLRREVKEEVNIEIGKLTFLLDVAFIRPDDIPVIVLSFYAPYVSGEVVLSAEDTAFRWVKVGELSPYDFIADIADEIRMVDQILSRRLVDTG
jgi:8-oxo-dGTP pyrophosphatase MutT (NUDIX family)